MEDVAIAYGFNNLPRHFPGTAHSVAAPLPINKLADIIRLEVAMAGWAEVMPLILCSHDENYGWLQKPDDGRAIRLQNPKTAEYQIVRTSLLPGLLKTSGFEQVHGLLDRVMVMLKAAFVSKEDGLKNDKVQRYWIEEVDDSTYLAGHAAAIYLSVGGKAQRIGTFGILHPKVLRMFELPFPTSTLEINVEVFL